MQINKDEPRVMHIDLNSCFAIIEQQANPLIRNKPVAVAAYDSPRGAIIASSYEAKVLGIKLGLRVMDGRAICKDLVVMMPDADKYFDANRRFREVLLKYTNNVVAKSVDEFVVDFSGSPPLRQGLSLVDIGYQIKQDIKESLGNYVTVNVGIGQNRFLAKLAAGLNKPDGLDVITHKNMRQVYSGLDLVDLPGINKRYKARLCMYDVTTPLEFLDAPLPLLRRQVFKGIVGYYWYMRLRGYEIDAFESRRGSFGNQYALGKKTANKQEIARLLMKLCEKTGRRLRRKGFYGGGIHFWMVFEDRNFWAKGQKTKSIIYSTQDIYLHAHNMLQDAPIPCKVINMGVTVFNLAPFKPTQLGLFDDTRLDSRSLAYAADEVNDRFGEYTLVPAVMANMQDVILKRVAFGQTE